MLATAGAILMTLISLGLFRPPSVSRPQDHAGQQGPAVSHPLRAAAPRDIYA